MRRELSARDAVLEAFPLAPLPLVRSEDPAAHDHLAAHVTDAVAPENGERA
jgi:hypothetical protein